MHAVLLFLMVNWYLPTGVLAAVAYWATFLIADKNVKKRILKYLNQADKSVFGAASTGVPIVANAVYATLPMPIRAVMPRIVFDGLVTKLFDEAKAGVDALAARVANDSAPVAPVATPVAPVTPATPATPIQPVQPAHGQPPQK